jgi:hypothetical protein
MEATGIVCNKGKETAGKDLETMKGINGSRLDA